MPSLLSSFIITLGAKFELSDLGTLSYFWGLEATFSSDGLCLSQTRYILDLLSRHSTTKCKPCSTPLCAKTQLSLLSGDPLSDFTEYRQLVGSLQYLTFTCPDIAHAVHHVAQFMSAPRSLHLIAAKRILRRVLQSLALSFAAPPTLFPSRPLLMLIGLAVQTLVALLQGFVFSWVPT